MSLAALPVQYSTQELKGCWAHSEDTLTTVRWTPGRCGNAWRTQAVRQRQELTFKDMYESTSALLVKVRAYRDTSPREAVRTGQKDVIQMGKRRKIDGK